MHVTSDTRARLYAASICRREGAGAPHQVRRSGPCPRTTKAAHDPDPGCPALRPAADGAGAACGGGGRVQRSDPVLVRQGRGAGQGTRRPGTDRIEPVEPRPAAPGGPGGAAMGPHRRAGQQRRPRSAAPGLNLSDADSAIPAWTSTSSTLCSPSRDAVDAAQVVGRDHQHRTFAAFEPASGVPDLGRVPAAAYTKLFAEQQRGRESA